MTRRSEGFTLTELMVGIVVMGIMGIALTQILVNDSRFVQRTEAMMNARHAARAAMTTMGVELAMVSRGGLVSATPDSFTVRVPYAFGVLCEAQGSQRIASIVPVERRTYDGARADGLAWRDDNGTYTFMDVGRVRRASGGQRNQRCINQGITVLPDARGSISRQAIRMNITDDTLNLGDVFYLYQTIRYRFAPSRDLPGRVGLWRKRNTNRYDELLAPFDSSANFAFFLSASETAQANPPVDLNDVVGLELNLAGSSETTPRGMADPPSFLVSTRVNFANNR